MHLKRFAVFPLLFLLLTGLANAKIFGLDFVGRKAERVEDKRVEKKLWSRPEGSSLTDKSFPIKEWNKHFSGLGSKRAPIAMSEKGKKDRYKVEILDRKTTQFEMSRWNERMADLHKRARVQMDDRAQIAADHHLYRRMMSDAREYRELGETLTLRDINRYQFRRNHSSDEVPVQKAGAEGE
ncbi:MAG: hypothetical protein ACNA77_04975 [Opitutales bacterium]